MNVSKRMLENLVNRGEVEYWAKVNNISLAEDGTRHILAGWVIEYKDSGNIKSVERKMDEPREVT